MAEREKLNMRQEQAFETRGKLLQSALVLFAENGYAGTQVRVINRSVGLADGLMYHYFPGGKKEILQVLINESFQKIVSDLRRRNETLSDTPIADALETIFRNYNEVFAEHLDVFKIFFKETRVRELVDRKPLIEIMQNSRRWFPEYLRKRAEMGEIREIDYDSATEMLAAVLISHFMIQLASVGSGPLSDPEHRKRLITYQVNLWKKPQP